MTLGVGWKRREGMELNPTLSTATESVARSDRAPKANGPDNFESKGKTFGAGGATPPSPASALYLTAMALVSLALTRTRE